MEVSSGCWLEIVRSAATHCSRPRQRPPPQSEQTSTSIFRRSVFHSHPVVVRERPGWGSVGVGPSGVGTEASLGISILSCLPSGQP